MKDYTHEEIYTIVGKKDKTASITFKYNSDSSKRFGQFVTVVFLYTQKEREELDQLVKKSPFSKHGNLKVKYLAGNLSKKQIQELELEGINSSDISTIDYFVHDPKNTFHSKDKRTVKSLNIPIRTSSKGGDYDWIYGFQKKLVTDGIGLTPMGRCFYLAMKFYFEPDNLSEEEVQEIYPNGDLIMKEEVEWELFKIKYQREELSQEEKKKCALMFKKKQEESKIILNKYLNESGSSLKKLIANNIEQAAELLIKVEHFKDIKLNVMGSFPIYLDVERYLHVYMRHVEEMQVNKHFEHKDNFQWNEKDVTFVMQEVINQINDEVQEFFKLNPGKRYSRYGEQSIYFQGDYYTVHIEPTGRISTFHKNRKNS
ncbi:hypothetical protein DFQ10_102152 [Winogradskyella eximia]|uniref:Uncharacterized protein n=1 Tax=Winogradskyella eximia TaxID=262006 RepID=A0A3D9H721_9FLAO|nr:hypothetical protein [Winogradskyella eximia]RED45284.1 hypothetical protein DFQ10_102152 [Winogradskyella eximia]